MKIVAGGNCGGEETGLFKPLFSVAGGNNSKFVQFLMSPRKRAPAKQNLRRGGGAKQVKEKGYFLSCGLHGAWNVWNKFVGFGFWIWSILLKRCDLNSRVSILDAVLFMQFDVLGRQVKDLVLVWFCGFGMWLTTEQNVLVAWTRGLSPVAGLYKPVADRLFGEA
ncbi:hypothetical protein F2Q69_00028406 [Brassica cretica]|uniref:Uncharacterized protein n=1 Tax=Brassica cretica TaxID=69181 RepID=A0A8S9RTH7_BRACR|nr:hypothetical protein F2Q69_00028406 [Brassica cretica]